MYVFLIEAGGLSQMARIHAPWHQRFIHDLDEVLSRHRFSRARHEADTLFYHQIPDGDAPETDALLMVDAMRALLAFLRSHGDTLLDYLVILGYDRNDDISRGCRDLERQLRFVGESNSLYLTETVFSALEPVVETRSYRGLHRLVSFCSEERVVGPSFRHALTNAGRADEIRELVSRGISRQALWVWGDDRAVTTATVQSALEREGVLPVTIQCRAGMTRADFERTLIAELPDLPSFAPTGSDYDLDQALTALRACLRDPGAMYLSSGWIENDLALVATRMIHRFLQSESQRLLFIADYDLLGLHVSDILTTIPEAITVSPVVVSGIAPPGDERWEVLHIENSHRGDSGYDAALRYWYADPKEGGTMTEGQARSLSPNHRRVLYLVSTAGDLLVPAVLDRLMPELDITPVERSRILTDLHRIGLVANLEPLRIQPAADLLLDRILGPDEREMLAERLARIVLEGVENRSLFPTTPLWRLVQESSPSPDREHFFHQMIHGLAAGGNRMELERVLTTVLTADGRSADPPSTVRSARIRLSLREPRGSGGCSEDVQILAEAVRHDAGFSGPLQYTDTFALSLAEYHLSRRDYTQALDYCKKAILLGQDSPAQGSDYRGAGQLLMARIALSQRRLRDATQYLGFAREDAADDPATLLTARMLEAVRLFLHGDFTRSAAELHELIQPLLETGFTEWLLFNWFLRARIRFELGEYDQARAGFDLITQYARGNGKTEPARTASIWAARSVLQVDPENHGARELLANGDARPEALLVLGEALCRCGNFTGALPLLQEACVLESRQDRWPRLGVCWDNGFASVEDLIIASTAGTSELLRIATAYRAWALAETGGMDEAVSLFFDLTRGIGGIGEDPYAGLYNYLYSSILPRERSPERDDSLTVLGKAVKLIQERTSRIDDYKDKTRFLNDNVWNRRLITTARTFNLV